MVETWIVAATCAASYSEVVLKRSCYGYGGDTRVFRSILARVEM